MEQRPRFELDRKQLKEAFRDKAPTFVLAGLVGAFFKSNDLATAVGSALLILCGILMMVIGFKTGGE